MTYYPILGQSNYHEKCVFKHIGYKVGWPFIYIYIYIKRRGEVGDKGCCGGTPISDGRRTQQEKDVRSSKAGNIGKE